MRAITIYGIIAVTVFILVCTTANAAMKYNSHDKRWETVPSSWEMKYNALEKTWSYQPEGAEVEYNPFKGTWDWSSGHGNN